MHLASAQLFSFNQLKKKVHLPYENSNWNIIIGFITSLVENRLLLVTEGPLIKVSKGEDEA